MNRISTVVSIKPLGELVLIELMDGAQLAIPPSELYHGQFREHDAVLYNTDDMLIPVRKVNRRG